MQEFMQLHHREHFRTKVLNPLIKGGLLKLTRPDKPTSPIQIIDKAVSLIKKRENVCFNKSYILSL